MRGRHPSRAHGRSSLLWTRFFRRTPRSFRCALIGRSGRGRNCRRGSVNRNRELRNGASFMAPGERSLADRVAVLVEESWRTDACRGLWPRSTKNPVFSARARLLGRARRGSQWVRGEAGMPVGVVAIRRVAEHAGRHNVARARTRLGARRFDQAAVKCGRVGLECPKGSGAGSRKRLQKDARHKWPLLVVARLAFDDGRERHDFVKPGSLLARERFKGRGRFESSRVSRFFASAPNGRTTLAASLSTGSS